MKSQHIQELKLIHFKGDSTFAQDDQSMVLASLSELAELGAGSNAFLDFVSSHTYDESPSSTASQPRAAVAHLFINNKTVMSRSKEWTSILDPVRKSQSTKEMAMCIMLS